LVAHVASKVGEPMKPVWLDLDVEGMPPAPGHTSPELRGRLAITTTGEIIPVPANADEEPDVATVELTVDEHGRAKGTLALLLKGRDAHDLTNILEELAGEDRVNALKGYVLGWLPGADVLEVTASQDGWWFVLTAKVELSSLLALDGKRLAIPGAPALHSAGRATTLGATYAAQAKRTTALTIRDAIQYRVHRVIHLPPSTSFTTPLPSLDVTEPTSGMRATRKVSIDGDTMIDDVAFALPTCVVSIEAFPAWTKEARIIDDGLSSVVRVTSPSLSTESPKPRAAAKPTRGPAPKPR
jgi:hypothetical protein